MCSGCVDNMHRNQIQEKKWMPYPFCKELTCFSIENKKPFVQFIGWIGLKDTQSKNDRDKLISLAKKLHKKILGNLTFASIFF